MFALTAKCKIPRASILIRGILLWGVYLLAASPAVPCARAGECLTTNEELFRDVLVRYQIPGAQKTGEEETQWGLSCWTHEKRMDAKLKKTLHQVLVDSRIHPSLVAGALQDYKTVFGTPRALLEEVKQKQGPSRYLLVDAILRSGRDQKPTPSLLSTPPSSFPPDTDFINGPAKLYRAPNGNSFASLPDNTRVSLARRQGEWIEVAGGALKGWVKKESLVGQDVQGITPEGSPFLSRAAYLGYLDQVSFLLQKGAQVNALDRLGRNAVHWAVLNGAYDLGGIEMEIVNRVCSTPQAELDRPDREGSTPLLLATGTGRPQLVKALLDKGARALNVPDKDGDTPLILAVEAGNTELVRLLLDDGAEINAAGAKGMPPLSLAIAYMRPQLVAELLKDGKLNVDVADRTGRTPIYHAVASGQTDLVRLLLARNPRTDTVSAEGKTLFHALFESEGRTSPGNLELLAELVSQTRADVNLVDRAGQTPLSLVVTKKLPQVLKKLLTLPALKVNDTSCPGGDCLNAALAGWDERGSEIALLLLSRQEIDVNRPDSSGNTPVHMAWYVFPQGSSLEIAKTILKRKPNLEALNASGQTPLMYNIEQKKKELIALLVAQPGIDLDNPGRGESPPLKLAEKAGLPEVVELLRRAGAHEYLLLGTGELSPEGIPQALLQNEATDEVIRFNRVYFTETAERTLAALRAGKKELALTQQEFVLDQYLSELGETIAKLSRQQRGLVKKTFQAIAAHYARHPRVTDTRENGRIKKMYATLEADCAAVLAGKYDSLPDGELGSFPPMGPILILRNYMVQGSMGVLESLHAGNTAAAERQLVDLASKSRPRYYTPQPEESGEQTGEGGSVHNGSGTP